MGRTAHSTPDGEPLSDDEPGTPLLRSPITTEESAFASSVVESRQELSQEDAADLATAPYPTQVQLQLDLGYRHIFVLVEFSYTTQFSLQTSSSLTQSVLMRSSYSSAEHSHARCHSQHTPLPPHFLSEGGRV